MLAIEETLRSEARLAVTELEAAGVRQLVLATGDRPAAAERVSRQLDLKEYRAGVLPEDKLGRSFLFQRPGPGLVSSSTHS